MYFLLFWLAIVGSAQARSIAQQVKALQGAPYRTMLSVVDKINVTDELGRSFFHYAVIFGNVPLAKIMLAHGANANFQDKEGNTPINYVLQGITDNHNLRQMLILSYLIEQTTGINATDELYDKTPLEWAMLSGSTSRIEELLKAGASLNRSFDVAISLQDEKIWWLLWKYRRTEIIPRLVRLVGEVGRSRIEENDLVSFIEFSFSHKNSEWDDKTVKSLLIASRKASAGVHGRYALDLAIFSQNEDVWRIFCDLMEHDIGQQLRISISSNFWGTRSRYHRRDAFIKFVLDNSSEMKPSDKQRLLALAINLKRTSLIQPLIDSGADIETPYNTEKMLPIAAKVGARNLVEVLIANRIDIEQTGIDGRTALATAAYHDHVNIVKLLLTKKANIDALDNRGKTAFMLAAYQGQLDTVRLLYDKGAKIDTLTADGNDALSLAALGGHYPTAKLLISYGLKVTDKTIEYAILGGNKKLIKLLEKQLPR